MYVVEFFFSFFFHISSCMQPVSPNIHPSKKHYCVNRYTSESLGMAISLADLQASDLPARGHGRLAERAAYLINR